MPNKIYRYTELPFALQVLSEKQITLLSPSTWDDKNDAHFVDCFRTQQGHSSLLALCLTEAAQTYHHWKIFTVGASGVCIAFNKEILMKWLSENPEIMSGKIIYKTVSDLRAEPPTCDQLPFLKRKAYIHENEFRLIYCTNKKASFVNFEIPIEIVDSVMLNPWMPRSTVNAVKRIIRSIDGCEQIRVVRASIVENDEWRKLADNAVA